MANEYKIQDLIDQYLRGELAGEALDKFRNRLRDDQDFARKVELQEMLVAELQEERRKELKAYIAENAKVEYIQNIWGKKWMYASAAITILAVGLYFAVQRMDQTPNIVKTEDSAPSEQVDDSSRTENAVADTDLKTNWTGEGDDVEASDSVLPGIEQNDIAIVEEHDADAETRDEIITLNDLGEEERKIAADDSEKVLKDSIVLTRSYDIVFVDVNLNANQTVKESAEDLETIATQENKRSIFRRNKDKNKEAELEDVADSVGRDAVTKSTDDVTAKPAKVKTESVPTKVKVEFWKSIVGFKGYRYAGSTVQLYGVDHNSAISFKKYGETLYINIAGTYFALIGNNQFNRYTKVSDGELLKILMK